MRFASCHRSWPCALVLQQRSPSAPSRPSGKGRAGAAANTYASTYRPFPSQDDGDPQRDDPDRRRVRRSSAGRSCSRTARSRRSAQTVTAPAGAVVIDADGKWVTPGIIDTHSHLGVYPAPGIESTQDGNEMTSPNTAEVWAEHSLWPHDPQFELALAGGVTSMQLLPGSANLFGGRGVTIKNVPSRTAEGMKFPGAPHGLKMACGENPKRVYGGAQLAPATAMGNMAGYRKAWIAAAEYRDKWKTWRDGGSDPAKRPERNLQLETLAGVLDGEILVHNHCYRGDEMAAMINLSKEFGYKIASFHHAVEAYKVRDLLAKDSICASMWADWWGFKLEAYDGIKENIALVDEAKGCAIVHSDDPNGIAAAEPGSRQGDACRLAGGHQDRPRRRDQVADDQPGACARDRQGDRLAGGGEERRRRHLVRRSVQRLRQGRAGVHRRRAALRPQPIRPASHARLHDRPAGPGHDAPTRPDPVAGAPANSLHPRRRICPIRGAKSPTSWGSSRSPERIGVRPPSRARSSRSPTRGS